MEPARGTRIVPSSATPSTVSMSGCPKTCSVTESPGPSGVNGPTALAPAGRSPAGTGSAAGAGAGWAAPQARPPCSSSTRSSSTDSTPEFDFSNTFALASDRAFQVRGEAILLQLGGGKRIRVLRLWTASRDLRGACGYRGLRPAMGRSRHRPALSRSPALPNDGSSALPRDGTDDHDRHH